MREKNILKLGRHRLEDLERKDPSRGRVGVSGVLSRWETAERERERLGQGPASAYGANHFHKKTEYVLCMVRTDS